MSPDGGAAPEAIPAPIIVTARFGAADHAWLDGLRRAHFPPERNRLDAHLTLFHHLPPSLLGEIHAQLAEAARSAMPGAMLTGVMKLGRGTAFAVRSEELSAIRQTLTQAFASMLTPQDAAGWRPHVTVQNKVSPDAAAALHTILSAGFVARPVVLAGLATWYYRGGPWEPIRRYPFRG